MSSCSSFCASTSLHGWTHMAGASTKARVLWLLTIATMMVVAMYLCQRSENSNISFFDGSLFKQHYVSVFIFTCDNQSCLLNGTHRWGHFSKGGHLQQIQIEVKLTKCCFQPFNFIVYLQKEGFCTEHGGQYKEPHWPDQLFGS